MKNRSEQEESTLRNSIQEKQNQQNREFHRENRPKAVNQAEIFLQEVRSDELIDRLTEVWRRSVKKTHLFLSDQEIGEIEKYVPAALLEVPTLVTAVNTEGEPIAFMGTAGERLEMLFLEPEMRGSGLGRRLLTYGIEELGVRELCVNEHNPLAKGFYEHMGFECFKRTELDEQGNPYPLLYMRLTAMTAGESGNEAIDRLKIEE
ncbi:GNAT family N-acetyltransferase [Hungatella sp. SB206]|uniref:GNAT family N-acetyltransferase n=1 Tax=Hungatella sp. SB206 TaxID=2937758 RepID=UPI003DA931FE